MDYDFDERLDGLGKRSELSTLLGRDVTSWADSVLSGALELSD